MKWVTHKLVAVGAAYLMDMPLAGLGGALVGSVMPDVLDQRISGLFPNRQKVFNRIHRGATHWFGWWLALLLAGMGYAEMHGAMPPAWAAVAGVGFGGLAHVLLDMCTVSGVPLVPWSRKNKVSLALCKTGSAREYAFLGAAVLAFGFLARKDIFSLVDAVRRNLG